jgi:hypothetical protein
VILYTAEMELPSDQVEAFTSWYAFRHAPDLYQAGFLACASFRGTGPGMNILNLYCVPGWDTFETTRYLNIGKRDPHGAPINAAARAKANTPYEVRASAPGPVRAEIEGSWLTAIRFEADDRTEAAIAEALQSGALTELGAIGAHLVRRSRPHPTAPSDRPSHAVLIEWAERPPPGEVNAFRFGSLPKASTFVGYRVYPWPDAREQAALQVRCAGAS